MRFTWFEPATATSDPDHRPARIAGLALSLLAGLAATGQPAAGRPLQGIDLRVTLGTDVSEGACGSDTRIEATRLDLVNFCYRVTNQSDVALNYQSLDDDVAGSILSAVPVTLAPGASHQFNRIVTARQSQSPVSTWNAYDVHPGYAYGDGTLDPDAIFHDGFDASGASGRYDFVDITATGTPLNLEFDDHAVPADIGFPFTFYGLTADQIMIGYNGGLLFDLESVFFTQENTPLPSTAIGPAILPYWTDIYYQQPEDGNIYYATLGTAPNRRFVVEWFNLPVMIGGIQQDSATFEAVLYEGSDQILFQYADTSVGDPQRDDGITATIGLNAPDGVPAALQYSYKQASVSAGKAILFSPTTPVALTASEQVEVAVGVPQIVVTPGQFDVSAAAGASTSGTLTIGNIGDRPLTWNLGSIASNAHFPRVPRITRPFGDPASSSALPAPRSHRLSAPATDARAEPLPLAAPVAAFGIDLDSASLVGLDAANPTDLTPVASVGDLILTAGAFVDENFGKLYALDYYTTHLLTIDTASGAIDLVGTAALLGGSGISWSGLAWDPTSATLYAIAYQQGRDGTQSFLYTIDPLTATPTLVGAIGGIGIPGPGQGTGALVSGLAVDADGLMYGIDILADDFVAIDKSSGAAAVIGSLGFDANYAQGLDFDDYTATLYYSAFDASTGQAEMYTIDTASGALTEVAPIGTSPSETQLAAFAIARLGGVCAYPDPVPWLSFSATRGSTAAGDSTPVGVTFDASSLDAGIYRSHLCVTNNDATQRRVAVPVTFTVN
ncbi:hypothetical protein [Dokdonella sp.]|uniref:hypothetical protein n=1 Tax=Dokdonella sp. TaxID=2291710 RepID=UPI001B1BCE23|nr:hypothetical protein [Dokdonella sp.]MBO9664306.1 hypothetical protein [Dokdonella sp.]